MSAVTKHEIVEALRIPPNTMFFELMRIELINRIEQHGIAPPGGWVLVPVEPTYEMQKAAHENSGPFPMLIDYWKAMLAAAPEVKP